MGGEGWSSTGPYLADIAAAFRQAQERELRERGIQAESIDELWRDPEWHEYVFTGGTGSVLDFFEFVSGEGQADAPGRMRLLTDAEVRRWAPDGRPTYSDWTDADDQDMLDRACGNCTVLYRDGQPFEIGYWGVTAD